MARSTPILLVSFLVTALAIAVAASAGSSPISSSNFLQTVDVTWGGGRGNILADGQLLTLSLDKTSGSGFQSKDEYLFGRFDMEMKLVAGNSAGTVTTFYMSSEGPNHDEIDFEFLGNTSGNPYVVHTNVFSQGKGGREQQFYLWFDPTADFHTYSILWNPQHIIFLVDGIPLRDFPNQESTLSIPFPKSQPMRVYSSLWDAEEWATCGGRVKTDWTQAPFTASYRSFTASACVVGSGCGPAQTASSGPSARSWFTEGVDPRAWRRMKWARRNYMVYDYCKDVSRFPQGTPAECRTNTRV